MVVEALTAAMLYCAATNENRSPVFLDAAFINNDVISVFILKLQETDK